MSNAHQRQSKTTNATIAVDMAIILRSVDYPRQPHNDNNISQDSTSKIVVRLTTWLATVAESWVS